ncbi:hypothetical protein CLV63_12037 [Murinocardiopsis flavida]|uniref:Uncharacterized protein n=1 Tax=Murinocardiopsis flavida TaxID=645275 RepID=A0A2P8D280_9ACTN|nr:hypothetical protein [Murinocardiopsis flavida]PSK91311.1 hypothetical protein CLV63_12037 [Murinocardiopsis flavida]
MANVTVSTEDQNTGFIMKTRDRLSRGTRDAGAGIVEYAALVVLAAAILAGLIASGVTKDIQTAVTKKVDCLMAANCKAG